MTFIVESGTDVRLVDALAERYELQVVTRTLPGGREISWPPLNDIEVVAGPGSRLAFARFVRRHLRRSGARFVLAQGYGLAALAASRSGTPSALLVCSPVEEYYACRRRAGMPGKPFRRHELLALQAVARLTARSADRYVVLSQHLRSVVRRHGARAVEVIPLYGVDARIFRPPENETPPQIRRRLGLPEGPLLFFSSRVAPEKDARTLVEAVARLISSGRRVHVLHRSGGWREFLELARAGGITERVTATDASPPFAELADDYRASDVTVQASRAEGLGFSVLESLACGTPVVAAAVGGLRETVRDGITGWTYPAGNADRLAEAIAAVLADPEEARRRAGLGREMVLADYERQIVFDAFDRLVTSAIAEGR
jgi:glycosyltransferase involved in cell wall biosynthesis